MYVCVRARACVRERERKVGQGERNEKKDEMFDGKKKNLLCSERKPEKKKKYHRFSLWRIEDILIPPDLHKSSVICYRLNKIIFTERRSKERKKKEEESVANLIYESCET